MCKVLEVSRSGFYAWPAIVVANEWREIIKRQTCRFAGS